MKKLLFFKPNFQTFSEILAYDKILGSSEPRRSLTVKCFGKAATAFNYVGKILHLKSLIGLSICIGFEIHQGSEYCRIFNAQWF